MRGAHSSIQLPRLTWTFVADGAIVSGVGTANASIRLEAFEHDWAFGGDAMVPSLDVKRLKSDGGRRGPNTHRCRLASRERVSVKWSRCSDDAGTHPDIGRMPGRSGSYQERSVESEHVGSTNTMTKSGERSRDRFP